MKHIMIDIEAMDTASTAAIGAIAAVPFNPATGETGWQHYERVDIASSQNHGGTISAATVKWWLHRESEARAEIAIDDGAHICDVLITLNSRIKEMGEPNVMIWTRGTDYDLPIIYSAMRRIGIEPAWKYWNARDVRSVEWQAKEYGCVVNSGIIPFEGQPHHALYDALHQIKTVHHIQRYLGQFMSEGAL
jgi:exodeoxyribonuclease VIII